MIEQSKERTARVPILPIITLAFLVAGAMAGLWDTGRAYRFGIWMVGLVLTGAPLVLRTLRFALRGQFATDLVAMLAIMGAVALREPLAGLVVVLMQSGGEWLERLAEGRASEAVRHLEAMAPRLARRITPHGVEEIAVDDVRVGDRLLVRPGDLVPVDGEVVAGEGLVDTVRLTGESVPIRASPGVQLASGSENLDGALDLVATSLASESQYARIVQLVTSAQATKAPLQRTADRYAVWFTPIVLVVCLAAWLFSGDTMRVLAVLVVATPCPLILATPVAIIGGINRAARRQIVVRTGGALEQLASVDAVLLDKTGTLTLGQPEVSGIRLVPGLSEMEVLGVVGAVEQRAGHLLARTLTRTARERRGAPLPQAAGVTESPGRGASGLVDDRMVRVGTRAFALEGDGVVHDGAMRAPRAFAGMEPEHDGLRAYVSIDGEPAAVVEFADRVRSNAAAVIAELQAMGLERIAMLSGDHTATALQVASEVGIDDVRAELRPEDKIAVVDDWLRQGHRVLMVGDGTNDAPALSAATVGVALAAHGDGLTSAAADVVLLADDIGRIPEAVRIGRRTMRIARQSIQVGLGLSAVAMVAAAFGYIRPSMGALLQEAIDLAVLVNALRTSRAGPAA